MESQQPTEILEHIFKQFCDLKSLTKCFDTCQKWRQTIEERYKNKCEY